MTVLDAKVAKTGIDETTGYASFQLGSFTFRRDEYFAHVGWPDRKSVV